jgi:hypothetical protein
MQPSQYERTFQISSEVFWGYRMLIDISNFDSIKSITDYMKNDVRLFLSSRNLQLLIEKLDTSNFHIHSPFDTFEDLLRKTDHSSVIYVCDHCMSSNEM